MNNSIRFYTNLTKLKNFASKLAKRSAPNDIILLQGDLGSGKTTFARFFIIEIYNKMKIVEPKFIKSPTFPIMISYDFKEYELYHYDFFRLQSYIELIELNFFENIKKNVSIIEWPEILLEKKFLKNYYLITFRIENINLHSIEVTHSKDILPLNIND